MLPNFTRFLSLIILTWTICTSNKTFAQSGTDFWFAPPDITDLHNSPGGEPLFLFVSSTGLASTVTISQPANPSFNGGNPIVVTLAANESQRINLTAFKSVLETRPTNTIVNTGLRVQATTSITCYYECANTNNTDIWALKGPNALGTEFYIPLHKHAAFPNQVFASPHLAFASFDICATENNTVVTIYSPTPVDGYPALQQFSITLNAGQTYSCGWTGANYTQPSTHPSGAVVLSDKPITVSLKDDSNRSPAGGCFDILGDQIVPTDVVGTDYIAVKGALASNGDESVVLMATQNNTRVFINGSATPVATLFAGEYYRIDMDYLSTGLDNSVYIRCTEPTYAMHITGFGCEMGMAQLPPLNCAGSQAVNFVRGSSQTFYLTILCRTAAVNGFTITGPGTATIPTTAFVQVPGTAGVWSAARITYNTTQIPVDQTFRITNSIDVFALGLGNGGASSGCKYGYFSEFVAPITASAGPDQTICANATAQLNGAVSGGTTTGIWSSTGTGSFTPNNTALNAVYTPSAADAAAGSVTLTLTSTGACTPVSDVMTLTISPAPTVNAGADQTVCRNNSNVSLSGSVTVATGGIWTGGAGTFIPNNTTLNAVYVPTTAELNAGSLALTLTTTGNGICNPISDNVIITFTAAPVVNAGADLTRCGNNAAATLAGSVTIATGGVWTGGAGSFAPSANTLNAVYTPTAAEVLAGSVTLTLTSTGNGLCNSVSDQVTIFYTTPPTANAGADITRCANNANATLAGSVTIATGGQWSGGLGTFSPNANTLNATYTPTATERANGSVTLTLTTTGNGQCLAATDQVIITFTPAPTANAGADITVCANNATAALNGAVTVATGGVWSGGSGTFSPNANTLNATYTPSLAERNAGSVTLTLTTTGNGLCTQVTDQVLITITPAPIVNAGTDRTACANNAAVTLAGSVTNASGGQWSGGAGTFSPNANTLNAIYTPTAAEIAAGSVTLTLTSTGNGSCVAVTDQMIISYSAAPTVNAGPDQVRCANNATINLAGAVTIATGGQWSGGLGVFTPNNNTLNATYTPTATEIASGSITLTLTSTGNGLCTAVTDQVTIQFTAAPTANAGADITVCANNASATLNGSISIASGGVWSGGTGTFSPNANALNATYTPSLAERNAGTVTLTLTTTGNGLCNQVTDQVVITINPAPIVNAGADRTACANNAAVTLAGSVTNATGGQWTGGAGTFSPNANTLNAIYTPTAAEIAAGSVTLTLTSTGNGLCLAVTDQMVINYTAAPTVNAGPDQVRCANNASINLAGAVTIATGGQWSGGLGLFSPNNNTLNATYTPTAAEIASGSITLTLTSTGNGLCTAVTDQITIQFTAAPTANAGSDILVCANNATATLNGSVTVATGGVWSGGNGTFSPNANTLNATYTPTATEIAIGSVTLTLTTTGNGLCNQVTDQVTITIAPAPIVNAGLNISACANNSTVSLSGQVFNALGGVWTGGAGTYFPSPTVLNATYTPTAAEIALGSLTLTLTSTGNGTCSPVSDEVVITFAPAPIANAGNDQTVCGNNPLANLNGFINFAAGGQWSGGLGVFSPSANALNASYQPTATEIANGFVELTLTTSGNGTCVAVSDIVRINYTPSPVVNAGTTLVSCENNAAVNLNGSVAIANGGTWSGGSGTFIPNPNALNAQYIPSASEINSGGVVLTLTSTGNGLCLPETSSVIIDIVPAPSVNAGLDQTICVSNLNVQLSGSVSGTSNTGVWSSSGSGTFIPNNTALNAIYECSAADSLFGSVTLTLTSTGNGTCNAVTDQMNIVILPAGLANAGANQTVCGNNAVINISGVIGGGATSGQWGTTGTGTFSPSINALNATYTPSATDIASGEVFISLTANSCNQAVDTLLLTITPARTVNAGANQTICADQTSIQLEGQITGGVPTGVWTTSGSGTFSPNNTTLNATYTPSPADVASQIITLTLTTTNNGSCAAVTDQMTLNIFNIGGANAGPNQTVCGNNANVQLAGSLTGAATTGVWTSSGTGVFSPSSTAANAIYQASEQDVINGNVTLTWSATNSCNSASDEMIINFTPAPTVNAGSDQFVCGENPVFNLSANFTNATGIVWSGGSGSFTPNATSANVTYAPTQTEQALGSVSLTITTTGIGDCLPVSDVVTLTMSSGVAVNAGQDQTVCISADVTQLQGLIANGTTTGVWTTSGSGNFIPDASALNAIYEFSEADRLSGSVTFTLTPTNTGNCPVVTDEMTVTFSSSVFVQAGNDAQICASQEQINLSGIITGGATQGNWTTNGSGTFSNSTDINAAYTLSETDRLLGSISFYLVSTNNGSCEPGYDTLVVSITPISSVSAGNNLTVCSTQETVNLAGNISGASTTGAWSTLGTGTFEPSSVFGETQAYSPSAGDIQNGFVELVLTANNTGLCVASNDTLRIDINTLALVNAGADQIICAAESAVTIIGNVVSASGSASWNASGTGSFTNANTTLNNTYNISASDISTGSVTLTLSSNGNGACPVVSDELVITIIPTTAVNAGPDRVICGDQSEIELSGIITGSVSTGIWNTTGTGAFAFSADELVNTYILGASDLAVGTIELTLTSTNNQQCPEASDAITIIVEAVPTAAFSSLSDDELNVVFTDESVGADSWSWSFENGATSSSQNPTVTFPSEGQYGVTLVVTNTAGCSDTIVSVIQALSKAIEPIAVPTGFSPNGDGGNDVLHVLGGPFESVDFKIFNGWGNLIFSTTDPKGGWDGTYQGTAQPVGVYVYTVSGKTIDGKNIKMSGNVTLIR